MGHWMSWIPEDFMCGECSSPPGVTCKTTSGLKVYETHKARKRKWAHEQYIHGLLERCTWTSFGGGWGTLG